MPFCSLIPAHSRSGNKRPAEYVEWKLVRAIKEGTAAGSDLKKLKEKRSAPLISRYLTDRYIVWCASGEEASFALIQKICWDVFASTDRFLKSIKRIHRINEIWKWQRWLEYWSRRDDRRGMFRFGTWYQDTFPKKWIQACIFPGMLAKSTGERPAKQSRRY